MCHDILMLRGIWDVSGPAYSHYLRDCVLFFVGKNHWILFLVLFLEVTGNWRLCSNSTAGWSIGRCFGFKMGLSCWSQLLVVGYYLHPLGCCQWCSTSTCDPLGFGAGRRWLGWENDGEKLQKSAITLGKHWTDCPVIIRWIPIVCIGLYLFLDLFWAHKSIRRSY